jgi:hypothetical protein
MGSVEPVRSRDVGASPSPWWLRLGLASSRTPLRDHDDRVNDHSCRPPECSGRSWIVESPARSPRADAASPSSAAPRGRAGGPKSQGRGGQSSSVRRVRRAARRPESRSFARSRPFRVVGKGVPLYAIPRPAFPRPNMDPHHQMGAAVVRCVRCRGSLTTWSRLASSAPRVSLVLGHRAHFVRSSRSRITLYRAIRWAHLPSRRGRATITASRSCGSGGIPAAAMEVAADP